VACSGIHGAELWRLVEELSGSSVAIYDNKKGAGSNQMIHCRRCFASAAPLKAIGYAMEYPMVI
jgi:hypothetical protein